MPAQVRPTPTPYSCTPAPPHPAPHALLSQTLLSQTLHPHALLSQTLHHMPCSHTPAPHTLPSCHLAPALPPLPPSAGEVFDYLVSHGRMKEKEARAKFRQVRRDAAHPSSWEEGPSEDQVGHSADACARGGVCRDSGGRKLLETRDASDERGYTGVWMWRPGVRAEDGRDARIWMAELGCPEHSGWGRGSGAQGHPSLFSCIRPCHERKEGWGADSVDIALEQATDQRLAP